MEKNKTVSKTIKPTKGSIDGTKPAVPPTLKVVKKAKITDKLGSPLMKGSALMAKLWEKMLKDGISPATLADTHLGIAYSYLMMLGRGDAPVSQLKVMQYEKMANYLGIPLMQVLLLAEAVKTEDFYYKADLPDRVEAVYTNMKQDPVYMGFAPNQQEWDSLSSSMRLSMCVFYENCCQTKILNVAELIQVVEPT